MATIEVFDNPNPERDYTIEHVVEEFTSVCPKTGHPDFAEISIIYVPDGTCIELKALKLYLQGFRNEGIFYEAVTNRILDDLVEVCSPRMMEIESRWRGRGGIRSVISATYFADGFLDEDDGDD